MMLTVTIFFAKNSFLIVLLSIYSEKFYIEIEKVQSTFTFCVTDVHTEEEVELIKNVLRYTKTNFRKIKPCQMFTVDGTLPLKFLALSTTYVIVLLQFAFV